MRAPLAAALLAACAASLLAQAPSLTFKASYMTGIAPGVVLATDLNSDGKADLVTLDIVSFTATALLGNGDGTFQSPRTTSLPCQPVHGIAGDFVKDGKPDLLVVCIASPTIYVLPGKGDGTFGTPIASNAGVNVLGFLDYLRPAAADFNGDGNLDLAFLSFDLLQAGNGIAGSLYVLPGKGTGSFGPPQAIPGITGASLSTGDFNYDGKPDLVISSPKNLTLNAIGGQTPGAGPVTILLGNGDLTFQTGASYPLAFGPAAVTVADANSDGIVDLVVNGLGDGLAVLIGKGDGTFAQSYSQTKLGNGLVGLPAVASLRGNAMPDIAIPYANCCTTSLNFLMSNGDGTYQALSQLQLGFTSTSLIAADFDGDGRPDVAAVSFPASLINLTNLMNYVFHSGQPDQLSNGSVLLELNTAPFPLRVSNSASFKAGTLTPESIGTLFGGQLATGRTGVVATTTPLPTSLNGATVTVTDSQGTARTAPLFYAGGGQINFQVPSGTAAGAATIKVTAGSNSFTTTATISAVAPGIYPLNAGFLSAAALVRVSGDGKQTTESVYQLDANNNVVPKPISLGAATDQLYPVLFGTGFKNAKNVTVTIGGSSVPVLFVGAQGTFVGLDQINVGPLPQTLAGQGRVKVVVVADGVTANTTYLTFQ